MVLPLHSSDGTCPPACAVTLSLALQKCQSFRLLSLLVQALQGPHLGTYQDVLLSHSSARWMLLNALSTQIRSSG